MVHFLNNTTRINKVDIMVKKLFLTQRIIIYCNIIKQQYSFKVAIIYTDKETSLRDKFKDWIAKQGITLKRSAPNT